MYHWSQACQIWHGDRPCTCLHIVLEIHASAIKKHGDGVTLRSYVLQERTSTAIKAAMIANNNFEQ
jgi:hypothetical protein